MNTIFVNSKNSKTCDPHRAVFNLLDKINLKRKDKQVALSILRIRLYMEKYFNKSYKNIEFKISAPPWIE